jgi:type IV secretory pathway VirB2 component (pilin)
LVLFIIDEWCFMVHFGRYRFQAQLVFVMACAMAVAMSPSAAYAGPALEAALGASICQLVNMMTGVTGRSIATLAVMFLGIGSFFGKANWGLVLTIACGITIIFGAADIAQSLGVTGAGAACPPGVSALDIRVGGSLCLVAAAINGTVGKTLASLAVIFVGLASFFGKASWQLVITTVCGIAITLGAAEIVQSLVVTAGGWGVGTEACLPTLVG